MNETQQTFIMNCHAYYNNTLNCDMNLAQASKCRERPYSFLYTFHTHTLLKGAENRLEYTKNAFNAFVSATTYNRNVTNIRLYYYVFKLAFLHAHFKAFLQNF